MELAIFVNQYPTHDETVFIQSIQMWLKGYWNVTEWHSSAIQSHFSYISVTFLLTEWQSFILWFFFGLKKIGDRYWLSSCWLSTITLLSIRFGFSLSIANDSESQNFLCLMILIWCGFEMNSSCKPCMILGISLSDV